MTVQATNYDGSKSYNLLQDSDIVNNLTSGGTNKALSAQQGKVLSGTLNNVKKFCYVSKVLQIPTADAVVAAFTLAELKELLGVTSETNFYNYITAAVINGAKNTNKGNIIACNYEETNKLMIIKTQSADIGSMRCNFLLIYNG